MKKIYRIKLPRHQKSFFINQSAFIKIMDAVAFSLLLICGTESELNFKKSTFLKEINSFECDFSEENWFDCSPPLRTQLLTNINFCQKTKNFYFHKSWVIFVSLNYELWKKTKQIQDLETDFRTTWDWIRISYTFFIPSSAKLGFACVTFRSRWLWANQIERVRLLLCPTNSQLV